MRSPLSICLFYASDRLAQSLSQYLRAIPPGEKIGGRYTFNLFNSTSEFLHFLRQALPPIDCLILEATPDLQPLLDQLRQQGMLFPAVILPAYTASADPYAVNTNAATPFYHPGTLLLPTAELNQIGFAIDQAISKFIQLSSIAQPEEVATSTPLELPINQQTLSLKAQQLRLAKKLKERLGYLGVYYKRNPQNFLRHMTPAERDTLLRQLKKEYREIILTYFTDETGLNQKLDNFVNTAFFADVPVSQIVEIHMNLMDEFSKQLKLEGRSDEILQDYRLTLIDTIAHLCEMYRRSIPRES
ncbi:MAG TPA: circadian clock protein KaiA [Allocoleopsis sp.]